MLKPINYSEILNIIKTKDDFNSITKELNKLENSLFELNNLNVVFSDFISKALTVDSKELVLNKTKEELNKIKFLSITLSEDPTKKVIKKLSESVKLINQNIVLDINIDPKIIAGALFSFEGRFIDVSLKSKLDNVLKNYI